MTPVLGGGDWGRHALLQHASCRNHLERSRGDRAMMQEFLPRRRRSRLRLRLRQRLLAPGRCVLVVVQRFQWRLRIRLTYPVRQRLKTDASATWIYIPRDFHLIVRVSCAKKGNQKGCANVHIFLGVFVPKARVWSKRVLEHTARLRVHPVYNFRQHGIPRWLFSCKISLTITLSVYGDYFVSLLNKHQLFCGAFRLFWGMETWDVIFLCGDALDWLYESYTPKVYKSFV